MTVEVGYSHTNGDPVTKVCSSMEDLTFRWNEFFYILQAGVFILYLWCLTDFLISDPDNDFTEYCKLLLTTNIGLVLKN